MKKHKKGKKIIDLDRFHYHEALDRAYMIGNLVDEHLAEHPVVQKHPKLKKRVEKAAELIAEAYQIIGGLDIKLFPDQTDGPEKQ